MSAPYYQDDLVTLYHGSLFDVLPQLGQFDACIADPPYGQTALAWDRWPDGWIGATIAHTSSLLCFGTMRMFLDHQTDFSGWKFAQDIVWRKSRPASLDPSRFLRQHEMVAHWYRGKWSDTAHQLPKVPSNREKTRRGLAKADPVRGSRVYDYRPVEYPWVDDGTRYMTSVIDAGHAPRPRINPTEKPLGILEPLIKYAIPEGGVVLDPFAGSCSTGIAARRLGRRAVLIELREEQCELAAIRLERETAMPFDLEAIS